MKKILVPVDFNPLSRAALEYAGRLARRQEHQPDLPAASLRPRR
jgi:hypothetical protein